MRPHEHPGVSIEETSGGPPAIESVETSTTAFVGEAASGPHGVATRVRSVTELAEAYGDPDGHWRLGDAVRQFFENGGHEAWISAVPPGTLLDEGLPGLEAIDHALLCLPGESDTSVLAAALEHASRRGAFVLVDPPSDAQDAVLTLASELRGEDGANGAIFYPPVRFGGSTRASPPSGAVAGMYARTDRARGVWKAPAGADAALRGVTEPVLHLTQAAAADLSAQGVNCIRRLGAGPVVVWGARTLTPDPEWKYVSVRRLLLFLEHSIERGTQWAVFEPNDEPLWALLRGQCSNFLATLFRAGAFQGQTDDEAYFVRCGPDTMTREDIEHGRLVVLVGVAPVRPAEFVVFRIEHLLTGAG